MPDKELKSTGITLDGTPIALRPLLPEDEPALQDLFAHMSREDVRLRFFTPMRELKHALAARLSHLDYSREMALVAQHDGMTLGIARYSADPDRRSAEVAVAVRSDWHGRGVGQLLMARLIEVAQQSGISELVGLVLHENKPMLKMCRKLGFSIAPEPNDATVLRVRRAPFCTSRSICSRAREGIKTPEPNVTGTPCESKRLSIIHRFVWPVE